MEERRDSRGGESVKKGDLAPSLPAR